VPLYSWSVDANLFRGPVYGNYRHKKRDCSSPFDIIKARYVFTP
jgi:hypothetical protein